MSDNSERTLYEKRPITGNGAGVITYTLLALGLALGGFYGLLSALETGDGRWVALLLACAAAVIVMAWRIVQHDARAFYEREGLPGEPQPAAEVKRVIQPHVERANGTHIDAGKYRFTADQWKTIGYYLQASGWRMVRDQLRKAKAWSYDEVNQHWGDIVGEFQRLGWADGNKMITDSGREWFDGWLGNPPPLSRATGLRSPHSASGGESAGGE